MTAKATFATQLTCPMVRLLEKTHLKILMNLAGSNFAQSPRKTLLMSFFPQLNLPPLISLQTDITMSKSLAKMASIYQVETTFLDSQYQTLLLTILTFLQPNSASNSKLSMPKIEVNLLSPEDQNGNAA